MDALIIVFIRSSGIGIFLNARTECLDEIKSKNFLSNMSLVYYMTD